MSTFAVPAARARLPEPATRPSPLGMLRALFARLHAEGVGYCQWKSNEHAAASMAGDEDLDLLADPRAAGRLTHLVEAAGAKRFLVAPGQRHAGVDDYVGFDAATGKLSHLHIHYQLTLGEKFSKTYRLPWEAEVLATRVLDAQHGLYVADPHLELLLLVTRAALKLRVRDCLLAALGKRYLGRALRRELGWLARRVDPERLVAVARPLVGDAAGPYLRRFLAGPEPGIRHLVAFRRLARPAFREYRMYAPATAWARRWLGEVLTIARATGDYLLRMPRRATRTRPQGGLTVAVASLDPARRRAVARGLSDWLAREAAVLYVAWDEGRRGRAARRLLRRARRARDRGLVVVWDGLPPPADARPELVVNLTGGPTRRGTAALKDVPARTRVVDVAAGGPDELLLRVKRVVWEAL